MKICRYCSTKQSDTNKFCENCGAPLEDEPSVQGATVAADEAFFGAAPEAPEPPHVDAEELPPQQPHTDWTTQTHQPKPEMAGGVYNPAEGRLPAIIAYFSVIGMIISLVLTMKKNRSEYTRAHQSQALVLALASMLNGWFLSDSLVDTVLGFVIFGCVIYSFIMACSGKIARIPLISNIKIF